MPTLKSLKSRKGLPALILAAGLLAAPAAVANAVADALGGARVNPPFSEDKLWRALREAGS